MIGDKANSLLQLVLEDLAAQGGVMKSGAIVDATITTSKSAQPNGGEVSPTDPDTVGGRRNKDVSPRL
ncbi:MAG: hypothetical protein K2X53_03225 [Alphaproteobacteria bacterium]|nr:hypothetical protein [Alphaproteobacteria bacterium]